MPEAFGYHGDHLGLSRQRQCTWSATEQAGEDAGGCGVLERAEGGGRGHSSEESAPVAAVDVQHWRSERWRCALADGTANLAFTRQTVKSRWAAELTVFFSRAFSVKF